MSLLDPQDWTFPIPIAYGPGRLRTIGEACTRAGMSRPLVVTDRGSANLPFVTDLIKILDQARLASTLYCEISPNPKDLEIYTGRTVYHAEECDGIIAIGGGSGMDGGKAIALTARNDLNLWDFEFERAPPDMTGEASFPPLITIPTTAGTGAETESTAMITDSNRMMKWCVWHADLKPSLALLDPELTVGLPPKLTAWTGADALVHAIEAYVVRGFHPLCDGAALEALRLIFRWLPVAVSEPFNLEARGGMMAGSCLAGVGFLKGLGLVHALSHMIGAEFDTHHGLTNAILLPSVLRFNAPAMAEHLSPMAMAMGLRETDFEAFYGAICSLLDQIGIPASLSDIGIPLTCADRIADKAILDSAAGTNPRSLSCQAVKSVLVDAIINGR